MSGVVQAMTLLKATFDEYAGKDGDEDTMTKAELSEMLRNELPEGGPKAEVDDFFSMLDNDKDGVVDFKEFVSFVTALAVMCCS